MAINQKHPLYNGAVDVLTRVRDAYKGRDDVVSRSVKYLPQLEGQSMQDYQAYLTRSDWTNYTSRLVGIMMGEIFKVDPIVEGIKQDILDNIDLSGSSFIYWAKKVCEEMILSNRICVLVDYNENQKRPYLTKFPFENVINWRTQIINGIEQLILVVIEKEIEVPDDQDKYKMKKITYWRELYLDNVPLQVDENEQIISDNPAFEPVYRVRDWQKDQKALELGEADKFIIVNEFTPLMNDKNLDFIPLYMCTCNGVSIDIQKPVILDIVDKNYSHYRTSADFENASFYYGNPTIVTRNWSSGDSKKKFPLGGVADFGSDGDAKFLELAPDQFLKESLQTKQEQIAVLGSNMMHGGGRYYASAETSANLAQGEHAIVKDISNSMDSCFTAVLLLLVDWNGGDGKPVKCEFSVDIEEDSPIDPQMLTALIGAYQNNIISFETLFFNLQSKNIFPPDSTIEDEKALIQASIDNQIATRDKKLYSNPVAMAKMKGIQPGQDKKPGVVDKGKSAASKQQAETPTAEEILSQSKY